MRRHRLLRFVQYSPIAAALLLAAVWSSVPSSLGATMLSTAMDGPVFATVNGQPTDRVTLAHDALSQLDAEQASRSWGDVRFAQAARSTALEFGATGHDAFARKELTPFLRRADAPQFSAMRQFVKEFPDARVDAYLIPAPAKPSGMTPTGASDALTLDSGKTPRVQFSAAWDDEPYGPAQTILFDPAAWNGRYPKADMLLPAIQLQDDVVHYWSYSWVSKRTLRRAYVFERSQTLHATDHQIHAGMHGDEFHCEACHSPETQVSPQCGDMGAAERVAWKLGMAMYISSPVTLSVLPQFTTRSAQQSASLGTSMALWATTTTDTARVVLPSGIAPSETGRWVSAVWCVPQSAADGQTTFFVASFPDDPHAAYTRWVSSSLGSALFETRTWLAVNFPWLLTAAFTLLGVSLIGAPIAFGIERKLIRTEQTAAEIGRIQRDAHDRVYNRLAALAQRVDDSAGGPAADTGELSGMATDIRATVADLQAILGEKALGSESPGDTLVAQLRAVAAAQGALHGVDVEFSSAADVGAVPARLGWDLQCVLDEAITNAVRHGHARVIRASLEVDANRVRLSVADDGTGVAAGADVGAGSTGLSGMRKRLEAWGGTVALTREGAQTILVAEARKRAVEPS